VSLISLNNVSISFGADAILDQANLIIEPGERLGLIGRNGAGKSTLLKLIDSNILPDEGELVRNQGLVTGRLIQEVPNDLDYDIQSVIALGDDARGQYLANYYLNGENDLDAQQQLNENDGWTLDRDVKTLCSKFDLEPSMAFAQLSGGMKPPWLNHLTYYYWTSQPTI